MSTIGTPQANANLSSIQVLRGLAAAVVAFHCGSILAQPDYGGQQWLAGVTVYGKLGVNLFFLLSGFIILKAHQADLGRPASLPRYAFRRLVRIFPIYWIVLTLNIAVSATGLGNPDFSWAPANIGSAYLLVPLTVDVTLPLKVAWSLFHEIHFYVFFAVALVSARLALGLAALWLAAIAVGAVVGVADPLELLSPWNLYFLAGMGICWLSERIDRRYAAAFLGAAVAIFCVFLAVGPTDAILSDGVTATTYWFLPIFAALLLGFVLLEPRTHTAPAPLLLGGDASYSIYLIHTSVISALALLAQRLGLIETMGGYGFFALAFCTALAAGVVLHLLVERPLLAAARRFAPPRLPVKTAISH
jgi:exopolysaccharide production protein ExoZ